jgi:hypothetical protein
MEVEILMEQNMKVSDPRICKICRMKDREDNIKK